MKIVIHRLTYFEEGVKYYAYTTEWDKVNNLLEVWKKNGVETKFDTIDTFTFNTDGLEKLMQFINKSHSQYDSTTGRNPWFEQVGLS
jgi:hypothetical protein